MAPKINTALPDLDALPRAISSKPIRTIRIVIVIHTRLPLRTLKPALRPTERLAEANLHGRDARKGATPGALGAARVVGGKLAAGEAAAGAIEGATSRAGVFGVELDADFVIPSVAFGALGGL